MKNTGQAPEVNSKDSGILSSPLSFLRNGIYAWIFGGPDYRGGLGYYWSLRSANTAYSNSLYFSLTVLYPQLIYDRGMGFAVRCVQILHQSH